MKKILILGSAGMLGHVVHHYLDETGKFEIVDTSWPEKAGRDSILLDVTDREGVEKLVQDVKPDVAINCIGILIRGSQSDPALAIYVNSYFPHQLSGIMKKLGGRLIHISTDCVFSGSKGKYTEADFRDADDVYGRSKALGEIINDRDLTLRTSIVGPELKMNGEGLFHWFMKSKGEIGGYTQAIWGGVTTLELARAMAAAIEQELTGLCQITNNEPISKYDLLCLFKNIWGIHDVVIKPTEGKSLDKSLVCTRSDFDYKAPSYSEMLHSLKIYMQAHPLLYQQYRFPPV